MHSPNVLITHSIRNSLEKFLSEHKYTSISVLVDENTHKLCLPIISPVLGSFHTILIKSGEEEKHLGTCTKVWQFMTDLALDRKALLINLGGGVIGDMGGFCAATYKRGIDFIQIPTTLLSMVDASVGGKLGIDFNGFKNHIGVFKEPACVFIDPIFLHTLNANELRSGFAEILKHSLIADEKEWYRLKECKLNVGDWFKVIYHSVDIKKQVVMADPLEKGLRKILNFGHTIGHAVESHFLNKSGQRLLHGEAIAIGMIAESWLAYQKNFISKNDLEEIGSTLVDIYGKVAISEEDMHILIPYTLQDKKNEGNVVKMSLLEKIGRANYDIEIEASEIKLALEYYISLN